MPAELRDLTVRVSTRRWKDTVLDAVDLVVPDGKITALLGESGCGKSMAAAALTGSLPASARSKGQVLIDGAPVKSQRDWQRLRDGTVGRLPQAGITAFDPEATVGAQLRDLEERHGRWTVARACAATGYPTEMADLYPKQHSGGQIQRAALAAALLPRPRVLIADEPTASLDTEAAYTVWAALRRYADTGAAVLVITHDVPMLAATQITDHVALMRAGEIITTGDLKTLATLDDPYIRGFFQPTASF
jgi:peptide/nickel transport system ATP-binding protein